MPANVSIGFVIALVVLVLAVLGLFGLSVPVLALVAGLAVARLVP